MNYLSVYKTVASNGGYIKLLFELHGRPFTLSRIPTDSVGTTLKRITLAVQKAKTKQKRKKKDAKGEPAGVKDVPVSLLHKNGDVIGCEVPNSEAWSEGNVLHIGDCQFLLEENPPMVESASIPSVIMAGFPVVPTVRLQFGDKVSSEYKWFTKKLSNVAEKDDAVTTVDEAESQSESESVWSEVGQGFFYVPTVRDIGHKLRLSCKAGNHERTAHVWHSVESSCDISAGPGSTPFETRQLYTAKPISDPFSFRVASYNMLADCYLEDEATCEAWFGYCPKYALEIDYRQQLLLKEILGYNADILCLQETGRRLFEDYLSPVMKSKGYSGVAMYKIGVMPEGEAIFFRDSRFKLVAQNDVVLRDYFINDSSNKDFLHKLEHAPKVFEKLTSKGTVVQLAVLQCVQHPQDYICLVNTHLYFHPTAPFIRNLQIITILNLLKDTVKKLDETLRLNSTEQHNIGIVFCGDFNSLPMSGVVQLICSGKLEATHPDWSLPEELKEADVNVEMPSYNHQFGYHNCCGIPEFTTYTEGFKGVIDYIFASKEMFVVQGVIPMPLAEELQVYTAIPSPVMPSDHLALICELQWKNSCSKL